MGIGGSIFLIAVGALLAFAVDYQVWWIDIQVAGWVLMAVGLLGLALTVYFWSRRRAVMTSERRHKDSGPPSAPPSG